MRILRTLAVVLVVASAASAAMAQAAPPAAAAKPAAKPILDQIPAGALGYVVINNVKAATDNVEKFMGKIGLGQMFGQEQPGAVLRMLQTQAMLTDGFNPNGGAAAVMLDPEQFGVNLLQMIGMGEPGAEPPAEPPKLPFVLFVPGSSVKGVFGTYETASAGTYTRVKLEVGDMFAGESAGYVLLSPNAKALDAVIAAPKKASAELSAEHRALLARSDVGIHINMKIVAPIFNKLTMQFEKQLAAMQQMMEMMGEAEEGQPAPAAPGMEMMGLVGPAMTFYRQLFAQMDSVTCGIRLAETGVVLEEMVSFVPGGTFDKALAVYKAAGKPPLDRLPNLPYALALGAVMPEGGMMDELNRLSQEMLDKMLALPVMAKLSEQTRARVKTLTAEYNAQLTGMQIVVGGPTPGSGVFGLSIVLRCKNAATLKKLLAEEVALGDEIIKLLIQDPQIQKLKLTYDKAVDSVGGVSVDSITVSHPKLAELSEEKRGTMTRVLGEDKIRLLVASADDTTVVVTFGGGKPFLVEALKAATGGGTILAGPQVAQVLKQMPTNCSMLMLVNVGNLFDVIAKAMKAVEPDEVLPISIKCKTPVAFGGGVSGKSAHMVMYVPNELIKEIVGAFQAMMGPPPGAVQPGRGADDF